MKKIGLLIAMFMFLPLIAHAGWKFDGFDATKMDSYGSSVVMSITGPSKILAGITADPLVVYESENSPTISFFSIGILGSLDLDGTATKEMNYAVDFIKFKALRFGAFKSTTSSDDPFIDSWSLHAGFGWKF